MKKSTLIFGVSWNPIVPSEMFFNPILQKRINALGYKVLPNYDIEKM